MTSQPRPHRRSESGFALLLVFLMAAIAAITLYMEIPRIAFETQRQKEQLLVERGEQYKRAIQLFMRASNNQRWPASIDELESFNGRRFLRHRYKDPMTGKEEWRLIHIQNGILTDSLTNKPQGQKKDDKDLLANQTVGDYGSTVGSYGAPGQGSGGPINMASRRRPSDNASAGSIPGGMPGAIPAGAPLGGDTGQPQPTGQPVPGQPMPGQPFPGQPVPGQLVPGQPFPGQPGQMVGGQPVQPGQPGLPPGFPPGVPGVPGQPGGMPVPVQYPGQANPTNPNNQGGYSSVGNYGSVVGTSGVTGSQPNQPGASGFVPGPPATSQNFGGAPGYPTTAGAQGFPPGYPQPGMQINPNQQSAAQNLIGNLLTTPRPGGLQGIQQGQVMGGGIAGIASKADGDSIMIYKDHQNYSEWEFIFDPNKQKYPPPNPVSAAIGTPASQMGTPAGPGVQPGSQQQQNNPFMQQQQPDIRGGRQ